VTARPRRQARRRPIALTSGRTQRRVLLGALGAGTLLIGAAALSGWHAPVPPWAWLQSAAVSTTRLTPVQREFIDDVGAVARVRRAQIGLPPSLVVAMAINESAWGQSALARDARNYFGVKAVVGSGSLGAVEEDTEEVVDGRVVRIRAPFRAYRSLDESVVDLGAFLHENDRYAPLWSTADDPRAAARVLLNAGYATDPAWADKLARLIDDLNLERLDA
jgi:peptidoglycan hydrolase FlgJ